MIAYNIGIIDEKKLASCLNSLRVIEEYTGDVNQYRIAEMVVEASQPDFISRSPEDLIIERDDMRETVIFLDWIRQMIGDKDWDMLCMYVVYGISHGKIAEKLGVTQQAISKRFKRIHKTISRYMKYYHRMDVIKECFEPKKFVRYIGSPNPMGYPFEFLQKSNVGGRWGKNRATGRNVYISSTMCMLPEYFAECFGDDRTVCNLCGGVSGCLRRNRK